MQRGVSVTLAAILITTGMTLSQTNGNRKPARVYELERVKNARAVQLYADDFRSLTRKEKIFAYYLSRVAISGRKIAIDQTNSHALAIMDLCEEIISHPEGISPAALKAIHEYTKLFWINNGMYDYATARKFLPSCTSQEFRKALETAISNHEKLYPGSTGYLQRFKQVEHAIFNPDYMPVLTDKTPGHDFIDKSANNYYEGLTSNRVSDWAKAGNEKYPLNSKVVYRDGQIEELVWRTGSEKISAGMYATELSDVISNLEMAAKYAADEHQASTISLLTRYFKTGEPEDWERFNISWIKDSSNVDFISGFIEVYMDSRGQKGKFESAVYYTNKEQTKLMRKLAGTAEYFEQRAPWIDEYKKKVVNPPIANVVNVVVETGDAGPISAIGINLPNEQRIREKYGSKSILIHNVVEAYKASEPKGLLEEFCYDNAEVRRAKKYQQIADDLHTAMHEVLGHGSGKVSESLTGDPADHLPGYYSTLEEARADLVALWYIFDPRLQKLGLVINDEVGKSMYDAYVRNVFLQLRRIETGDQLEEDHMKNRQMVVNFVMQNSDAIKVLRKKNKTYFHITDYTKMHEALGKLLAEIMRIKAEGDLQAGKALVDSYGFKINTSWRDEVLQRTKKFKMSAYTGFVMPDLRPVTNSKGKIIDVKIEYPCDLTKQMLEYSGISGWNKAPGKLREP